MTKDIVYTYKDATDAIEMLHLLEIFVDVF